MVRRWHLPFSRPSSQLHVCAPSGVLIGSTGMSVLFVIGQSDNFGFGSIYHTQ